MDLFIQMSLYIQMSSIYNYDASDIQKWLFIKTIYLLSIRISLNMFCKWANTRYC